MEVTPGYNGFSEGAEAGTAACRGGTHSSQITGPLHSYSLCSQGWTPHSFLGQVLLNGKFSCVSHLKHNNKPVAPVQNTSRVHTCSHGNSIQHACTFPEISESFNKENVVCFIFLFF